MDKNSIFGSLILFLISNDLICQENDMNSDGKNFAESINSQLGETAKNTNTDNIPGYEGKDVEATKYYSRGGAIEDDALLHATDDPTSNYIMKSRNARPQFTIDETNDPLFMRENEIVDKSRSLTETYSDCVDIPVGTEDVTNTWNETCTQSAHINVSYPICHHDLSVEVYEPPRNENIVVSVAYDVYFLDHSGTNEHCYIYWNDPFLGRLDVKLHANDRRPSSDSLNNPLRFKEATPSQCAATWKYQLLQEPLGQRFKIQTEWLNQGRYEIIDISFPSGWNDGQALVTVHPLEDPATFTDVWSDNCTGF